MTTIRQRARWIAPIALSLVAVGSIAYATIPDSGSVIHGCYKKPSGALRVIDSSVTSCDKGEVAIEWGQSGPPGIPGTDGAPGVDGLDGVSGYEVVTETLPIPPQPLQGTGTLAAFCPAGKQVIGGGGASVNETGAVYTDDQIRQSYPYQNYRGQTGWAVAFSYVNASVGTFTKLIKAYAICANV